ncbi:MAG: hypothetical protein ACREFY_03275 [Acetobacteraceae bacterium]
MSPTYKFAAGQEVAFVPAATGENVPRGPYVVVRCLPFEGRDCAYRVKHVSDGHERVIAEARLSQR